MEFRSQGSLINYTDQGSGPAVLFLHALGRSASDWVDVISALASDFRCIAIDFPGHGDSERTGNYGFADFAQVTAELIDSLELESLSIVAHSMGATVAWILAPNLTGQLDALVVEDTAVPTEAHTYPEVPAVPPGSVDYDWEVRRQVFSELNAPDPAWREKVIGLEVAVLLVAGRDDDDSMTETAELLGNVRIVTIPAGHWIHQDALDEFLAAIRPFLLNHSTAG